MGFFLFPLEDSGFQLQPLSNVDLYQERRCLYQTKGGQLKRSLRYTPSIGKELLFLFFSFPELYWPNTCAWSASCAPGSLEKQRRVGSDPCL